MTSSFEIEYQLEAFRGSKEFSAAMASKNSFLFFSSSQYPSTKKFQKIVIKKYKKIYKCTWFICLEFSFL